MRFKPSKPSLLGLNPEALQAILKEAGHPPFRAQQILDWIYKKRVQSFDEMLNLPKDLRQFLSDNFLFSPSSVLLVKQSNDVTEKLLIQAEDQSLIETVLIRQPQEGVGQTNSRKTICVSSQVGCAYGCKFCASGLAGWKRDLHKEEIIAQFLHVSNLEESRNQRREKDNVPFDNIVFMGMGEPLANFDNLVSTIRTLNSDWGFHFGARRITVSTSG